MFLNKFAIKIILPFKNRKRTHHHNIHIQIWSLHIWVRRLSIKFQLKLTIYIFWTKFVQKISISILKQIQWAPRFNFSYLNWSRYKILLWTKVLNFWTKYAQIKTNKSERPYWMVDIEISLSTKFQLKLAILIFFNQICSKRAFPV